MTMAASRAEPGEVIMTQHLDPGTGRYSLTIDHADPLVLVSKALLECLGDPQQDFPAWQRNAELHVRLGDRNPFIGAILKVHGTNRTVIYRIHCLVDEDTYLAEWVD